MIWHVCAVILHLALLTIGTSYGEFLWRSGTSYSIEDQSLKSLCWRCANHSSGFLNEHCPNSNSSNGYHREGRCCFNSNNATIGLDLGNCSLSFIPKLNSVNEITWLNLDNNTQLNCSYSGFDAAFKGLRNLMSIYLPAKCPCPGGNELWNLTGSRSCRGQHDSCSMLNVTCPNVNSECESNGPGYYQCQCKHSWGGYRCLVQKGIPLLIIMCCIGGATILTVVVLWLLMRRRKKMHASGYTWVNS